MALVKTFLYCVRDAPALHVKYGFCTRPCLDDAQRHISARYRTYLLHCEVLHVVPVARAGRAAEAALKERLGEYHLEREFLGFPDEATLRRELAGAYAALACPEPAARCVESKRGEEGKRRKRAREEAELAAATQAALLAKKMKLEKAEARSERRRVRSARLSNWRMRRMPSLSGKSGTWKSVRVLGSQSGRLSLHSPRQDRASAKTASTRA